MKHEENVDLRAVSKVAKIDSQMKVIQLVKPQAIGIKTWGRIDYLCNIHGYRIVTSGITIGDSFDNAELKQHNRDVKKKAKEIKVNKEMNKKSKKR